MPTNNAAATVSIESCRLLYLRRLGFLTILETDMFNFAK